jgi:hypothetical protein
MFSDRNRLPDQPPSARSSSIFRERGIKNFPTASDSRSPKKSLRSQKSEAEIPNPSAAVLLKLAELVNTHGVLLLLKNGDVEWRTMPIDCPQVQEFFLADEKFLFFFEDLDRGAERF